MKKKITITDKNWLYREQYGKKLNEIKVLVENKEKRKCTAWSKERKQRHAKKWWEDTGIREIRKWKGKVMIIKVVLKGRSERKKKKKKKKKKYYK